MGLEGQVAVVYAAARGIGKAYCESLLQKGCKVCFGDILEQEGLDTQREFAEKYKNSEIVFSKCDVLIEAEVKELMSKAITTFGAVHIVISNAGIVTEKHWQKCLNVNLGGTLRVFYTAMEHMSKTQGGKGGHFVVTSSAAGLRPVMTLPVYTATKHGLVGFIRAWGTDENYQLTGIRCNAICPHTVDTNTGNIDPYLLKEHAEQMSKLMERVQEINQVLQPKDVGQSLITLLENEAANGQCLEVTTQGNVYFPFTEKAL